MTLDRIQDAVRITRVQHDHWDVDLEACEKEKQARPMNHGQEERIDIALLGSGMNKLRRATSE